MPASSPRSATTATSAYLRPDGKTQVTVRYQDGRPVGIEKVLISTQHADGVELDQIRADLWESVIEPVLPADMYDASELNTHENLLVNPTGRFVIGGPVGDAGLTGRKIIVDTYGGMARHGGGAFSGKDPSKVDRSAAYAARHVAKNIVAAELADRCEVQVAYAIGVAHPVSVMVEDFGTGKVPRGRLIELVREHFDLRPGAFRESLNLHRADLSADRRLRPLRPRGRRLHLGRDGQGRRAARSRGRRGRSHSRYCSRSRGGGCWAGAAGSRAARRPGRLDRCGCWSERVASSTFSTTSCGSATPAKMKL